MKTASAIARYLAGVIFLVFGLNGFLNFIPLPPPGGIAGQFMGALYASHYLWVIFAFQVIAAVLASCWVNQARACKRDWNNPAKAGRTSTKITAHSTATKRASGSPLGAIKAWKTRMLTITGASTATANDT